MRGIPAKIDTRAKPTSNVKELAMCGASIKTEFPTSTDSQNGIGFDFETSLGAVVAALAIIESLVWLRARG